MLLLLALFYEEYLAGDDEEFLVEGDDDDMSEQGKSNLLYLFSCLESKSWHCFPNNARKSIGSSKVKLIQM